MLKISYTGSGPDLCDISKHWQKVPKFCDHFLKPYFGIWLNFDPTLTICVLGYWANFQRGELPNIEQLIYSSGHVGEDKICEAKNITFHLTIDKKKA